MSTCCFCFRTKKNPQTSDTPGDLRNDPKLRHSERKIEEDLHLETYMSDYLNDKEKNDNIMVGGSSHIKRGGKNNMDTLNVEISENNNTKMYMMQSEVDHRDKSQDIGKLVTTANMGVARAKTKQLSAAFPET